jgi:hypothetical protein
MSVLSCQWQRCCQEHHCQLECSSSCVKIYHEHENKPSMSVDISIKMNTVNMKMSVSNKRVSRYLRILHSTYEAHDPHAKILIGWFAK